MNLRSHGLHPVAHEVIEHLDTLGREMDERDLRSDELIARANQALKRSNEIIRAPEAAKRFPYLYIERAKGPRLYNGLNTAPFGSSGMNRSHGITVSSGCNQVHRVVSRTKMPDERLRPGDFSLRNQKKQRQEKTFPPKI